MSQWVLEINSAGSANGTHAVDIRYPNVIVTVVSHSKKSLKKEVTRRVQAWRETQDLLAELKEVL